MEQELIIFFVEFLENEIRFCNDALDDNDYIVSITNHLVDLKNLRNELKKCEVNYEENKNNF